MVILFSILAYLLGSVSSSIVLCQCLRLPDPREMGSKNAGATNILRYTNSKIALFVLMADCLKGAIAVFLARYWGVDDLGVSLIIFFVTLGHIYPIFFRFRGGKGIATAFGGIVTASPFLGIATLCIWILIAVVTRYSSLASIGAVFGVLVMVFISNPHYLVGIIPLTLLVFWKHRENIQRLRLGTESKIGKKI